MTTCTPHSWPEPCPYCVDVLRSELARAIRERDEARAARNQLHADFCATDEALEKVIAQCDALRAAIEPTETNMAIYASAINGNWSFSGGEKEQARCVLGAIAARAQLPTAPSDTPECPPPERPPVTSSP